MTVPLKQDEMKILSGHSKAGIKVQFKAILRWEQRSSPVPSSTHAPFTRKYSKRQERRDARERVRAEKRSFLAKTLVLLGCASSS